MEDVIFINISCHHNHLNIKSFIMFLRYFTLCIFLLFYNILCPWLAWGAAREPSPASR